MLEEVKEQTDVLDTMTTQDVSTEDSETAEESSTEKTEGTDTTEKVEKTDSKDASSEESQDDEVKDDGRPIPYERFKKVIDTKNTLKTELDTLKADHDEMTEILNRPSVLKAILQSEGVTDPKIIAERLKEAGVEEQREEIPEEQLFKQFSKGLDLSKQESWGVVMARMAKHFSDAAVSPIRRNMTLSQRQNWVETQEAEARKIAKDKYGIEYGQARKDEGNPNTAVGKMWAYLEKHPEDAGLGHIKILTLALAEEGVKLGEKKGEHKEKERHKSLKESAMEDDAQLGKDETPNSEWPVSKILAWRRKYAK